MKVKDLIKELKECDQNAMVILSGDEEGNHFAPANYLEQGDVYNPNDSYLYPKVLTKELIDDGYTEEDIYSGGDGMDAVVIWP